MLRMIPSAYRQVRHRLHKRSSVCADIGAIGQRDRKLQKAEDTLWLLRWAMLTADDDNKGQQERIK